MLLPKAGRQNQSTRPNQTRFYHLPQIVLPAQLLMHLKTTFQWIQSHHYVNSRLWEQMLDSLCCMGGGATAAPVARWLEGFGRAQKRVYCLLPNFFCHCSLQLVTHIWCATTKNLVRRAVQSTLEFQLQLHKLSHTSGAPCTFSTSSCDKKIWCTAHTPLVEFQIQLH